MLKHDAWGNPHRGKGSLLRQSAFGEGRRCARASCITILNRYNPGPECLIHTAGDYDREALVAEKRH